MQLNLGRGIESLPWRPHFAGGKILETRLVRFRGMVKEHQVFEIYGALHDGVAHNHIAVFEL